MSAIKDAQSLAQVVKIINAETLHSSVKLAAEYAYNAQKESGYAIDRDAIEAHLGIIKDAGANFDMAAATECALQLADPEQSFYVITSTYSGPNRGQHIDDDTVEIWSTPARRNMSGEVITQGWAGTTNDWSLNAHGEFDTYEDALQSILSQWDVRDADRYGDEFSSDDKDVLAVFKPGQYIPMNSEDTASWIFEALQSDIFADTTDERIEELVAEYEASANAEGYTLEGDTEDLMVERRQELRDEDEDDDDE